MTKSNESARKLVLGKREIPVTSDHLHASDLRGRQAKRSRASRIAEACSGPADRAQRSKGPMVCTHLHSEREKVDTLRPFPRSAIGTQQMRVMTLIDLNECNVQVDNTVDALVSGRLVEVHTTVTSSTR